MKKYSKIILVILMCYSCKTGEMCEAFNFKQIPYNRNYYLNKLNYTNGKDTITLFPEVKDCSKRTRINSSFNPECLPIFTVQYEPKKGYQIDFSYSFTYKPNDKSSNMLIILNSSYFSIKVDSSSIDSIYFIENINHYNKKDSSKMIKNTHIKNMKIYKFETFLGEKWELIE